MMSVNLSDMAISADDRFIISRISKSEAINFMQNTDLTEKTEHYKT